MPGTLPLQTLQNTIIQAGRGRKKRRAVLAQAHISQSRHANGVRWERGRKNGTQERHSFSSAGRHTRYRSRDRLLLVMHDGPCRLCYEFRLSSS